VTTETKQKCSVTCFKNLHVCSKLVEKKGIKENVDWHNIYQRPRPHLQTNQSENTMKKLQCQSVYRCIMGRKRQNQQAQNAQMFVDEDEHLR